MSPIVLIIIVIVVLFLTNGGWNIVKNKWNEYQGSATMAQLKQDAQKVIPGLNLDIKQPYVENFKQEAHDAVDSWLALCAIPDIASDPEAMKALEILQCKILKFAMPKTPVQTK